jgi:predicted permease
MSIFLFAINAVLPLVLLILLGYLLRRAGFFTDEFLKIGNKVVFRVALPALLFYNVYSVKSFAEIRMSAVLYSLCVVLLLFFLGLLTVRFFVPVRAQRGAALQCVFRSNYAILGVSLVEALGITGGNAHAAVMSAFAIPLFNMLAVFVLSVYGEECEVKFTSVLKKIAKNPLILGVLAGFLALGLRALLPVGADGLPVFSLQGDLKFLYSAIASLAKMSSPLALLVLGGSFQLSAAKGYLPQILYGTLWRILLAPTVAILGAYFLCRAGVLSFDAADYAVLLALFGSPVAVSSAIMAREMKSDATLAGQYVVYTSVFSVFTIFLFVLILRATALI